MNLSQLIICLLDKGVFNCGIGNPRLVSGILSQLDWEGFHQPLRPEMGCEEGLQSLVSYYSAREFLPPEAGGHCGTSCQEYRGRGTASRGGSGADREAARVVLTVAFLSIFRGLELSDSSSPDVMERSDLEGVEVKERSPIL